MVHIPERWLWFIKSDQPIDNNPFPLDPPEEEDGDERDIPIEYVRSIQ